MLRGRIPLASLQTFAMLSALVKWSYRIAKVAGIDVKVHVTFLLLLALYGWIYYDRGGLDAALTGVFLIVLLFLCVLLHEFGHAFAGRAFGIRTPDITLLPIGGVARLERMPSNPWQEFVIAIAGPAVNVVIAAVLFVALGGLFNWSRPFSESVSGEITSSLLFMNILLIAFNMIPAFPMDGGRVLRALLAAVMPHEKATLIAARVGQIVAAGFLVFGYLRDMPMLMFIAVFVFMGAQQELAYARFRATTRKRFVGDVMLTEFETAPDDMRVGEGKDLLLRTSQPAFPLVSEDMELRGFISREDLLKMGAGTESDALIISQAHRIPAVTPTTSLDEAIEQAQRLNEFLLPVVNEAGQIVGILDFDQAVS